MPLLFTVSCDDCKRESCLIAEGLSLWSTGAEPIGLPHSVEDARLKELGETRQTATESGCLYRSVTAVCPSCGTVHSLMQQVQPEYDMAIVGLWVTTGLVFLLVGISAIWSVWLPLYAMPCATAFIAGGEYLRVARIRRHLPTARGPSASCGFCGQTVLIDIYEASRRRREDVCRLRCAHCGSRATQLTDAGIS